jgi:hypothetical protein
MVWGMVSWELQLVDLALSRLFFMEAMEASKSWDPRV